MRWKRAGKPGAMTRGRPDRRADHRAFQLLGKGRLKHSAIVAAPCVDTFLNFGVPSSDAGTDRRYHAAMSDALLAGILAAVATVVAAGLVVLNEYIKRFHDHRAAVIAVYDELNDNLTALRTSHRRSKAPDTLTTVVYDSLLLPLHIGIPDIVSVSVNGAYSRLRTLQRHPELLPRDLTDIGDAVDGLARYRSRLVGSWWERNVTKRGDFWLLGPLPGDRTPKG